MKITKSVLIVSIFFMVANLSAQVKVEKATKKFAWVDTDGNKEVTLEEMVEFHKDKTNKKGDPIDAKLMFLGLDSDDNGKLTLDEFTQDVNWKAAKEKRKAEKQNMNKSKAKAKSGKSNREKKFAWVDTDGNKEVTLEEMVEFHKGKTNKNGKPYDGAGRFYGLDANNDGKLTLEEFKQKIDWKAAKEKKAKKQ